MTDTDARTGDAAVSGARSPVTQVPLSRAPSPALDPKHPPWPGGVETSGGVTLHVRRTPTVADATAVYVHGLGGSSTNWTDLSTLLAPFAGGISIDLPGFGFTEPAHGFRFSLDEHADELIKFVSGLGSPVHLLGNSMGGAVSLLVSARRPDLVRSLTLISPAMPDLRPDPRRLSDPAMVLAYLPIVGRGVWRKLAGQTARERAAAVIKLCFADPRAFPEHRLDELAEEHSARAGFTWANAAMSASTAGIVRTWLARGQASLWSVAPLVPVPALVVWGSQDRVISVRRARRTADALPRGRLLVLPRTGHVAQMERPVAVARAVLGMWERSDGTAW